MNYPNLERLIEIIEILRSENGCKWDREQTHATLRRNMLEEAYEAVDAIDDNDAKHLKEELGDVLLQVVLHAQIAKEEKPHRTSIMDGISKAQAALMSAQKISKKAVGVGFEWPNEESLYDCVYSEIKEFKEAKTQEEKEDELGDILFAVVNLARWNKIDAEQALLTANRKFVSRFKAMEQNAEKELEHLTLEEWDDLWKKAKKIYS